MKKITELYIVKLCGFDFKCVHSSGTREEADVRTLPPALALMSHHFDN